MAGQTVLITGASTGIGEACARFLAGNGWQVFAGVRRDTDGERLAAMGSGNIEPVHIDVTDADSIDLAIKHVSNVTNGSLRAVVNNAGIGVGGPIEYIDLDEWRRQFEVNVFGQIAVTKACLPLLRSDGSGARIVIIGSIGGRIATPLLGPYAASKHALEAVAEALRHELRRAGIKVTLVEPGAIATPMWDKAMDTATEIETGLTDEARTRYQWAIDGFRNGSRLQARNAIPAKKVAEVVERALTAKRPKARALVGIDAKGMGTVARFLPDSLRDQLVRLATRG
jgi:NAD(P)-dependent dehydrogenase (short-subunit alcohol dehydrogenase family)